MQIVIATRGLPFDGSSLTTGSLGGSETAVICVARELAKLGHIVRVFCECSQPGHYDGVIYAPIQQFKQQCGTMAIDVLIASRWADLLASKAPAGLRVLWCHDILVDAEHVMPGLFQTDMLMLLSDFHIRQYCDVIPELRPHIWKTSNGVDMELIEKSKRAKVKKKLIYTSRPERGLHFLLGDILPKILERHPDVKVCCATYLNNMIPENDPAFQLVQTSEKLAQQYPDNVVLMGNLKKDQLYQHISSSQLWLYPTGFPEISCLGAMEAQACGTALVSTDDFALKETVGPESGILLDGKPDVGDYADRFAKTVCDLLDNPEQINKLAAAGPEWVRRSGYVWQQVAKSWIDKFEEMMFKRWQSSKERIVGELERCSDLIPAKRLAEKEGMAECVERINNRIANLKEDETGTLTERFNKATGRFNVIFELSKLFGKKIKSILDWRTGDISFGLLAAREYPEVTVTIYAPDDAVRARLSASVVRNNLANARVVDKLAVNEGFDLVVSHDQIDTAVNPTSYLQSLMAYVNTGGLVGFTSRFGSKAGKVAAASPDRLWNLDQADFHQMFSKQCEFKLAFSSEAISPGGDLVGHWVGCLRKTPSLGDPDVYGRKTRTRPYKSLAVCMITRNEEDWLLGCLKMVNPIADKMVIVDSKSKDSTQDIARSFGAEVREIDFDNFSQARNESISGVDADWILWLDADERLVGSDCIRRYLQSEICNGFGIRQNHLMLDLEKSCDVPIRLFKNKPQFRFTGLIHEQIEDVSDKPFDVPIAPSLIMPDVDIAHYGYINERIRRQKVSNRNLQLLIRDTKESSERLFTWVFVMRDYLNFVKWSTDAKRPVEEGSFAHICLEAAIGTYLAKFPKCGNDRVRDLAEPMYQEALKWLGLAGLCYGDSKSPPFEIGFTLTGAVGGLEDRDIGMTFRWFLNAEEYQLYMDGKSAELRSRLTNNESAYDGSAYRYSPDVELPEPSSILEHGCNLFLSR